MRVLPRGLAIVLCLQLSLLARPLVQDDSPNGPYDGYYSWTGVLARIKEWKTKYPDLVTQSSIGKTLEGRDIPVLRLTDGTPGPDRPEALFIAGMHPREQPPVNAIVRLTEELLSGFGKDPKITRLLKERVLWVVPTANVDGKVYDFKNGNGKTRGADWRKNRRPNPDKTVGVDLNRNFAVRWGGNRSIDATWNDTTANPDGNIYEGPSAFSEPETQALSKFIASRPIRLFVDIHCPLRIILQPVYLPRQEADRFKKLVSGMQALQKDPYPAGRQVPDGEPAPKPRDGNTGLTYTWAYYTQGVYALNFEFGRLPEIKGVAGRYLKPELTEDEYARNGREPLLFLLEATGDLPRPKTGSVRGTGFAASEPLTPGAQVQLSPKIEGAGEFAVLVSESALAVVQSEYRKIPVTTGFTIEIEKSARPGQKLPFTLYVWDRDRRRSVVKFEAEVAPGKSISHR